MNRLHFILAVILVLCLLGRWSWAAKAYVQDSFEISFYDGPSTGNKVIGVVSSGDPVEIFLSQDEWSFVRLLEKGENNKEGFILSKLLITRLPWKVQARPIIEENTRLKEKLARIEKNFSESVRQELDITIKLQKQKETLHKLQNEYGSFKQNAAEYLKLVEAQGETLSAMETIQKEIKEFTEENESLRSSQENKFFILEVLVLVCGFLVGLAIGVEQKKHRSRY
jgi:SH3 domain protein